MDPDATRIHPWSKVERPPKAATDIHPETPCQIYRCDRCGTGQAEPLLDEGVTPFKSTPLACECRTTHRAWATSAGRLPARECNHLEMFRWWGKPNAEELATIAKKSPEMAEHARRGGLIPARMGAPLTWEYSPEPTRRTEHKIGRNDCCPCGSRKKFKHCHGRQA